MAPKAIRPRQVMELLQRDYGLTVGRSTVWRWMRSGALESRLIGSHLFTTEQWVADFVNKCNQPREEAKDGTTSPQ